MTDISASEARKQFAHLLRKASSGETFTIVREGYPVATLGPPRGLSLSAAQARQQTIPEDRGPLKPLWNDDQYAELVKEFGDGSTQTIEYRASHRWTGDK